MYTSRLLPHHALTCVSSEPLCDALRSDGDISFCFTEGTTLIDVPKEYENFFGPPPNYTFLDTGDQASVMQNLRHFPLRETSEATVRYAMEKAGFPTYENIPTALEHLIQLINDEGDVEGVIGYSEGARVAASLILEEERRMKKIGRTPRIKCALFIGGWQAVHPVLKTEIFADETEERIKIPTFHVIGSSDPYIHGSMCLYNLCDEERSELFDHGAGHVLPREKQVVTELSEAVWDMIRQVTCSK